MAEQLGLHIGRNVAVDQPQFAALNARIAFTDVGPTLAQGLDLGPQQHDARLDIAFDEVIEAGTPIFGDEFGIGIGFFGHDGVQIGIRPRRVQLDERCKNADVGGMLLHQEIFSCNFQGDRHDKLYRDD